MIKLLLFCLCLVGVRGSALRIFDVVDDVANDAEIIDAAQLLPGTGNLYEKRVPVIRLETLSSPFGFIGTGNLAERAQVPDYDYYHYFPLSSPGVVNLEEKPMVDAPVRASDYYPAILRRYLQSKMENVAVEH